jgi:RND family efflux transporter MFP subunit
MHARLQFVIALSLVAFACRRDQPAPAETTDEPPVPVAAQPATMGRVRAVLHASGIMVPAEGAEFLVVAPEPGRVVEVTKQEGETVESGDVLVRLDIPSAAGDAARQRAEAARARADVENARVNQGRSRDLAERGLMARRELDDANRALSDAQAALVVAEAAQASADAAAARAVVRAPFAGVIASRLHNPGDLVQGSVTDPILRLVDPQRLDVSASVPAADLSRVLPGATARLLGGAGGTAVPLTVVARQGPGDAGSSGVITVRLAPLGPTSFGVDVPVEIDIDLDERPTAVLVPAEAIVRERGESAVFVAAGGRAERREVATGATDEGQVEITSGLRAGELVITRGHGGLEDGAPISVDIDAR